MKPPEAQGPLDADPVTPRVAAKPGNRRFWAGLLAAGVVGTGLRLVPWSNVFTSEGALLWGGDAFYHMHRVAYSLRHFPALLEFDPTLDHPRGSASPWPPGFDWTTATLLRPFVGTDLAAAEVAASWVPVVLAALAIVAIGLVGRALAGRGVGLLSALALAVLPAGYSYTRLGFFDHHAAVALLGVGLLGGAMALVARRDAGPRLWPLAAAGIVAALLYVWPGALIHIGVVQAGLLLWAWVADSRDLAVARSLRLALAHAGVALAVAPYAWGREFGEWGRFSPFGLTSFQPAYFGCAALALALATLAWRAAGLGATRAARFGSAVAIGAAGLVLAFLAIPGLGDILGRSAEWFTGDEAFHRRVSELEPILGSNASKPEIAISRFSYLFFGFPLAWMFMLGTAPREPARWMLAAWSGLFFVATLSQARFMNSFVAAYALVWAVAAFEACVRIDRRAARGVAIATGSALLLAALVPSVRFYRNEVSKFEAAGEDSRAVHFRRAARYLAEHAPPAGDGESPSDAAVLCAWGYGHEVRYYARRPVVQDNFGIYVSRANMDAASRYFVAEDEGQALAILDDLAARYVLIDRWGAGQAVATPTRSMTRRLVGLRGSQARADERPDAPIVPALRHHQLVYETIGSDTPLRLFERVAGARIEGVAPAGAGVLADLVLAVGDTRFRYRTSTRADAQGRYRLIVPYPTGDWGAAVVPEGAYQLLSEAPARRWRCPRPRCVTARPWWGRPSWRRRPTREPHSLPSRRRRIPSML